MSTLKIGVPSNKKIFDAFQFLVGEEVILPKGMFFVPFRGHELVVARVEEIATLVEEGHIDMAFLTKDHFLETEMGVSLILSDFSYEHCFCEMSIIASDKNFFNLNVEEAVIRCSKKMEAKRDFRKVIIATRFPKITENLLRGKEWNIFEEKFFPEIRKVAGAEELSVLLGTADFAVARVESGDTLKLNNLFVVERILYSCLMIIRHKGLPKDKAWEVYKTLIKPKPLPPSRVTLWRGSESIH